MSGGGWTVAETAQVADKRKSPYGGSSVRSPLQTPTELSHHHTDGNNSSSSNGLQSPFGHKEDSSSRRRNPSSGSSHRVRWRDDKEEENTEEEEVDLDKLLEGLDKLTETLPDLGRSNNNSSSQFKSSTTSARSRPRSPSPPPRPPPPTVSSYGGITLQSSNSNNKVLEPANSSNIVFPSVRKTRQLLQSRDTYGSSCGGDYSDDYGSGSKGEEKKLQPYHTLHNSKPFSYIRTNPGGGSSMPSSRNLSRASSKEALNVAQPGLQSPGLLRRIMGINNRDTEVEDEEDYVDSKPVSRQQQQQQQPVESFFDSSRFNNVNNNNNNTYSGKPSSGDEEASLTWLERQQRKLTERREVERRRFGLHTRASDKTTISEVKTHYQQQQQQQHHGTRSETTTDGYASDLASMLYSEPSSTRESSPHKQTTVYNIPVKVEPTYHYTTSTPIKDALSRQKSDTSFDRNYSSSSRPIVNRRLRYDSESSDLERNGFHASNTSIDSVAMQHYGGSRPITPAFPGNSTLNRVRNGGGRAPSPAGSLYQDGGGNGGMNNFGRRGSVSSEPAEVSPANVKLVKDSHRFWYKPHISREEAISMLRNRSPGTFVVRDSNSFPGAFGLALMTAASSSAAATASTQPQDLIRHFLIEPTSKGVKLKGYTNEPVFASLSALVYQHTLTQLALPNRLVLPSVDLMPSSVGGRRDSESSIVSLHQQQMQQLLSLGAACNVTYLLTVDTDSLTGPAAVKKSVTQLLHSGKEEESEPLIVHFKVSGQGITLTDTARKRFFRKHFAANTISHCSMDPEDRRWSPLDKRLFGFVAKKPTSRSLNQCHVFAEQDPDQPARAIVNFVNKVMMTNNSSNNGGTLRSGDVV